MKYIMIKIPVTNYYFMFAFFWKRKKDFLRANRVSKKSDACYQNYIMKNYPLLGEFHFVKGKIGAGMIAHEITHAAKGFARKMKKGKNEEYLCETAQVMTSNIWVAIKNNKQLNKWIYGKGE